jgi:hypothetical protein
MAWRLILVGVLLAVTLGCDRPVNSPLSASIATAVPVGLPLTVVSGTSLLTTTVFPFSPLTVPRGSTLACLDGTNNPLPPLSIAGTVTTSNPNVRPGIAGTVSPIIAPNGQPVTLLNPGTFAFGCVFLPTIIVTIIVV